MEAGQEDTGAMGFTWMGVGQINRRSLLLIKQISSPLFISYHHESESRRH
jgi:hypothetical protein